MDLPRYHRLRGSYYRLEGQQCRACRTVQFPPRLECHKCGSSNLAIYALSGRGKVYSYSEVSHAPHGFGGPYLVALVELDEGMLLATQLTDMASEDVKIGMRVEMVTRKIQEHGSDGYIVYGYKFRPAS